MGTGWENNRVSMLGGGGGGGATSTRRRTFHGSQRITRNLDESLASCDELEGSDATMSIAQVYIGNGHRLKGSNRTRRTWKASSSFTVRRSRVLLHTRLSYGVFNILSYKKYEYIKIFGIAKWQHTVLL